MFKVSKYLIFSDILDDTQEEKKRIAYSTRTGEAIIIPDSVYRAVSNNDFSEIGSPALQMLFKTEILVPFEENEFETILSQNIEAEKDSSSLSFVIQPTANCQLGCHYCGQSHAKHTMNDHFIPKIMERIAYMSAKKRYDTLNITWFGGEPLMGYSQIKKLSSNFIDLCKEKRWNYMCKIVTNAVSLKKNIALELINECKVTYFQITIDGTKEYHDQRRVTKIQANGTFDIILSNLLDLLDLEEFVTNGCFVEIRMNIDRTNYQSIPDLIDLLAENKIHQKNVGLTFAAILDWGGNGASDASLTNEFFAEQEIEWYMYAASKGFNLNGIIPSRQFSPCMVVDESAEVFDAYGNIFPCYELPITPTYDSPKYKIGNLMLSPETDNKEAVPRNWFKDIKNNISWCPDCTYFPVCGGGCPKDWYNSKPACPSFKFNGEDRIVLQHILDNAKNITELI